MKEETLMNIILKNENNAILDDFKTDVIKTLTGEQSLEEVQDLLVNIYYNKIIIDITAIKDHKNVNNVINFLRAFDPLKIIIIFHPGELTAYNPVLGKLVENGYYNFAKNIEGIQNLMLKPSSFADVEQYTKPMNISSLNPTNMDS